MRARIVLLAALTLGGCSVFHKRARVDEAAPAHQAARNASILGEWVLATSPDSTSFAGAREVQLNLREDAFTIVARYPSRVVTVTGVASADPAGGTLMMIPDAITRSAGDASGPAPAMVVGQQYVVIATAADNTMVFAQDRDAVQPSSVWHRKSAANAAGRVQSASAGEVGSEKSAARAAKDSTNIKKP